MRVLAVDFGDRRVGMAISDELGIAAHGLDTIEIASPRKGANAVVAMAQERGAGTIVVGMPFNMDGTKGPRAEATDAFCELLRRRTTIPVTTFDERMTSMRATAALREAGMDERSQRGRKDRLAATIVLQDYLSVHTSSEAGSQ